MERSIVKHYDRINDKWTIAYYRKYADSMHVQHFETGIFVSRTQAMLGLGNRLTGLKVKKHDQWFGYGFIKELAEQLPMSEKVCMGIEIKD